MLKGVAIGAGYFGQFHYEAWKRISEVELVAMCDLDGGKVKATCEKFDIPNGYTDFAEMLEKEKPDFVDIITPPPSHYSLTMEAAKRGIHVICQKPLAPTFAEAEKLVNDVNATDIRFMVHENFRFQPWHREIKKLLESGAIGDQLFNIACHMRMGDGWPDDAYLSRQPYFRTMPRLLIHETGIHVIDTFRYLGGEITEAYAKLKKLNHHIAGEDAGMVFLSFEGGANGLYDGNRYNESNHENPRYTFGTYLLEGNGGTIRLSLDGKITIQKLGETEKEHSYTHERKNFAGDCVYFTQKHFVENLLSGKKFETNGPDYLKNLKVQEAVYQSNESGKPVKV